MNVHGDPFHSRDRASRSRECTFSRPRPPLAEFDGPFFRRGRLGQLCVAVEARSRGRGGAWRSGEPVPRDAYQNE